MIRKYIVAISSAAAVKINREPLMSWEPKIASPSFPMGYKVPNLGVDHDISASQSHETSASTDLKHNWVPKFDEEDKKWVVPEPDIDFLKTKHGAVWNDQLKDDRFKNFIQLDREPLLTWEPTAPKGHPTGYFVPNFGLDHDIEATQSHTKNAESSLKH